MIDLEQLKARLAALEAEQAAQVKAANAELQRQFEDIEARKQARMAYADEQQKLVQQRNGAMMQLKELIEQLEPDTQQPAKASVNGA